MATASAAAMEPCRYWNGNGDGGKTVCVITAVTLSYHGNGSDYSGNTVWIVSTISAVTWALKPVAPCRWHSWLTFGSVHRMSSRTALFCYLASQIFLLSCKNHKHRSRKHVCFGVGATVTSWKLDWTYPVSWRCSNQWMRHCAAKSVLQSVYYRYLELRLNMLIE